jgi:hypothetical protein
MIRVPVVSDMLDKYAHFVIMAYFWPYFLAGNADLCKELFKVPTICKP